MGLRGEPSSVADCGHLNTGLCSIDKRIEHLRVIAGSFREFRRETEILPDRVRGRCMKAGMVAGALAGADNREPACPGPIDLLANNGRLVAVSQAVDETGLAGFVGQERTGDHIGFDIDHDYVPSGFDGREAMLDSSFGASGRFDQDVETIRLDQMLVGIGYEGRPGREGCVKTVRRILLLAPTDPLACFPRPGGVEISNPEHVDSRGLTSLRQEHGPKLAGSDEPYPDRLTFFRPCFQHGCQVHEELLPPPPISPDESRCSRVGGGYTAIPVANSSRPVMIAM